MKLAKSRFTLNVLTTVAFATIAGCSTPKAPLKEDLEQESEAATLDEFFNNYGNTKSADEVTKFLPQLDKWAEDKTDERLGVAGNMPLIGFFCQVFHSHPGQIKAWSEIIAAFKSAKLKELMAVSLYLADNEMAAAAFEKFKNDSAEGSVLRNLAMPLPKLDALIEGEINTPEQLDYCWGSYMATGELDYAMAVFAVAVRDTEEKINGYKTYDPTVMSARWSIIVFMYDDLDVRAAVNNRLRVAPDEMLEDFAGKLEREKLNRIFEPDLILRLKAIKAAKY